MHTPTLQSWAAARDIELTEAQLLRLARYQALVLAANESVNLTAITSDGDFTVKHFIDSLSLLPFLPPGVFSLLDIGTGAGFPGVPLKIARPDIRLTLLDSLRKRVFFLRDSLEALDIEAECVHARAEDMPRLFSGKRYDVCTARAVARLGVLASYALPLLSPGGSFLAMKGPDISREIEEARPVIAKKGGILQEAAPVCIAPDMGRTIIVIKKT
jgi:16S rRNA (guanine527-N7)-methyltransferase